MSKKIFFSLITIVFFILLGAGCQPETKEEIPDNVPDDGLDYALEELDLVDTEENTVSGY